MIGTIVTNNLPDLAISVTIADGRCEDCGGEKEYPDSTHCIECAVKALSDTEVFDA